MRTAKWQNILYIFLLLAAIFLLFQWYSATNSRQIEERNLNYAMDSARQAALRLDRAAQRPAAGTQLRLSAEYDDAGAGRRDRPAAAAGGQLGL